MKKLAALVGITLLSSTAHAASLTPTGISFSGGSFYGTSYIADGHVPSEGTQWQTTTTWWSGTSPVITFDYGSLFNIEDILVSVDNNDSYNVQWSTNASSWTHLFQIPGSAGDISWGVDTMTSFSGPEYVSQIDFSPVQARFIRIFAASGDRMYSVGEFQAYGTEVSAVPLPAAVWLFAPALMGLIGFRRTKKS